MTDTNDDGGPAVGGELEALVAKWRNEAGEAELNALEADSIGLNDAAKSSDKRANLLNECADELAAIIQSLTSRQSAGAVDGWLPIESAPKDGRYVLLYTSVGTHTGYFMADRWWVTASCSIHKSHRVTHWQPLPPPPAALVAALENKDG